MSTFRGTMSPIIIYLSIMTCLVRISWQSSIPADTSASKESKKVDNSDPDELATLPESKQDQKLDGTESDSSESLANLMEEDQSPTRQRRSTPVEPPVNDIQFDAADITEEFRFLTRTVVLEAFRIQNKTEIEAPHWVSVGHPRLVENKIGRVFHFTPESITANIASLADPHKVALAKKAKLKYPNWSHKIHNTSFTLLPLQQISCSLTFLANGRTHNMHGNVEDFHTLPWQLIFPLVEGNQKREAFVARIQDDSNLNIKCELRAAGKRQQVNILTITAEQMQENGVADKVLGPANEAYVTRDQMTQLAQMIRTTLNVEETYELENEDFTQEFIEKMIDKAHTDFRQVPIDEWLSKVSNFGTKWDSRNISPDEVKRELSNILKIENHEGEERIVRAHSNSSSSSKSDNSGSLFLDFVKNLFTGGFKDSRSSQASQTSSFDDQLYRFNDQMKDHVQWERDGMRIVPKSINVAKLTRCALNQRYTMNSVKKRISDAKYFRTIVLKTKETEIDDSWRTYTATLDESMENLRQDLRAQIVNFQQRLAVHRNSLASLRSTLSNRGTFLNNVQEECVDLNNHNDQDYDWSARYTGNIGLKAVGCHMKGRNWYLQQVRWTNLYSVSRGSNSGSNILHAEFRCCKKVYTWRSLV